MTYDQFIKGAEEYYEKNKLHESKGKAYMNFLRSSCVPCYDQITGSELDPTYSSRRFPGFMLFIQNHISTFSC